MAEKIKYDKTRADELEEFPADLSDPDVQDAFQAILRTQKELVEERLAKNTAEAAKQMCGPGKNAEASTKRLADKVTTDIATGLAIDRSLSDWRPILTKECQVYVVGQQYIAKRFDEVHYKYCAVDEAKEILTDNLYAILLYKYFPQTTDEVLSRIDEVVKGLTRNIKTFLTKISFENDENHFRGHVMKRVPNSAVAFSNGIFDFLKNDFIVKYDRIYIPQINNTIILYNDYIIEWNFDFDFDPLPIKITETSFDEFLKILRTLDAESPNYCWELFYNMTHDIRHRPSKQRMLHLAEIFGYTLIPQFLQYFILLIGSGQNGKNSLFDGCFSAKVLPRPVSNSIEAIEKDRFITESLENSCHNIFLETSAKTYTDSNMLKALTGSMYQTIECKGVGKYAGIINCKYVFAGNDQSNIKFSDPTIGFRRRINVFEIFYSWDPDHRFLRHGDYYKTDFSGDLHEIKQDITNTVCYIYLGMYGILSATKNFTRDFKFTYNEWSDAYADIDVGIKEFFTTVAEPEDYFSIWGDSRFLDDAHQRIAFFNEYGDKRLYQTAAMENLDANTYDKCIYYMASSTPITFTDSDGNETTVNEPNCKQYMMGHDIYVSLPYLRALLLRKTNTQYTQREFNDMFKKIFTNANYMNCAQREQYVRMRLVGDKIKFVTI